MDSKVRVLQVMHGLAPGGIESFVLNVYENIDKENIDINFSLACKGKQHHEYRVTNQGGMIYRTNDLNGIKNMIKHFKNLVKVLRYEGPFDVVHSHIDFFNGVNLLAAFIANVPIRISHAHNTNSAHAKDEKISFIVKIYRLIMRLLINVFATHRLGCSEKSNTYMYGNKLGSLEKSTVIYNGVDFSRFNSKNNEELMIENIKIDSKKINFITIGRMCEQKNSLFIPKIINELTKTRDDIHLYWIGQGPIENEVKELIKKYKLEEKITLLGTRSDISEILSNMDFMLFPSKWEGLPVTLVEAQVSNIPCFISNSITQEANIGLCTYIPLGYSEKQWADEINKHINNISYNNKLDENTLNKFNIKNVAKEIEKIYLTKYKQKKGEIYSD